MKKHYELSMLVKMIEDDLRRTSKANQEYDLLQVEVTTSTGETLEGFILPQNYHSEYENAGDDLELFKAIKDAGVLELIDYDHSSLLIATEHLVSLRVLAYETI